MRASGSLGRAERVTPLDCADMVYFPLVGPLPALIYEGLPGRRVGPFVLQSDVGNASARRARVAKNRLRAGIFAGETALIELRGSPTRC